MLLPLAFILSVPNISEAELALEDQPPSEAEIIRTFLESKKSPLADHTEYLLQQSNWKMLIAISAIESQYCKRKIDFNCWGIGGDSNYRHYSGYPAAIKDAQELLEKWHNKGRWLTVDDMNCSYVQPCNKNWVAVVNSILNQIEVALKQ